MSAPHPFSLNKDVQTNANDHVVRIRAGIQDKQTLLREVGEALKFPYWSAPNWDGFNDWVSDLSWISSRRVVVVHDAAPHVTRKDIMIYLETLMDAVNALKQDGRELLVAFPEWTRGLAEAWSGVKGKS